LDGDAQRNEKGDDDREGDGCRAGGQASSQGAGSTSFTPTPRTVTR
jgi:hypothetical protein